MRGYERARPGSDTRLGGSQIEMARAGLDIDEHRRCPDFDDQVGCDGAQGRNDNFVTRADAANSQRQFDCGGSGGDRAHAPAS